MQAAVVEQEQVARLQQGRHTGRRRIITFVVRRWRELGGPITRHEGSEGSEHGHEAVWTVEESEEESEAKPDWEVDEEED